MTDRLTNATVKEGGDFEAVVDGSGIVLLRPISGRAADWLVENLGPENQWTDDGRLAIERRYFEPIADGIIAAGMTFLVERSIH